MRTSRKGGLRRRDTWHGECHSSPQRGPPPCRPVHVPGHKEPTMKRMAVVALAVLVLVPGGYAAAQVAGSTRLGVAVEEMKAVALGWSVKKQILGQYVYNEQNQRVGKIDDLIIAPDTAVSFVIVGAGGFVGLGRHDIAVPVAQLKQQDGKYVLPGATKEAIKALPKFEYARKERVGDWIAAPFVRHHP